MFWFFGLKGCGILAPQPGIEPESPALEGGFLTTGSPGKLRIHYFLMAPGSPWCGFAITIPLSWAHFFWLFFPMTTIVINTFASIFLAGAFISVGREQDMRLLRGQVF